MINVTKVIDSDAKYMFVKYVSKYISKFLSDIL